MSLFVSQAKEFSIILHRHIAITNMEDTQAECQNDETFSFAFN